MSSAPPPSPLLQAAADLRYLLARGYGRELGLKLTGDRWGLDQSERRLLRRGVFAPAEAAARRARLRPLAEAVGQAVALDGHNVLITLETALGRGRLVLADDGLVRDIAELGRHHQPGPQTLAAARLAIGSLAHAGAASALVLLEERLPRSGELAARLRELLLESGLPGQAQAVPVPEEGLKGFAGLVASSDRAVVDQAARPLDLAGEIIRRLSPPPILESL
ncbi:MAG: DUF434 domain-containing protein [Thermodesulfobacteriota bacterium]